MKSPRKEGRLRPRALVEKPTLNGKEETCYSGSEQLGQKGGCWPGDGKRSLVGDST